MKIRKILTILAPISIVPTIMVGATSCNVIERINDIPKQIDGLDWTGRVDGLFSDLYYSINIDDKTVTYWNATEIVAKNLVIPNYVWYRGEKYKVILDSQCFINSLKISGTIELNDWQTEIPDFCFQGCGYLTGVIMQNYPTAIGNSAFDMCQKFKNIYVRKSNGELDPNWMVHVTSIGDFAFYMTAIEGDLTFSSDLTYIGQEAFYSCNSLLSVNLLFSQGITSISKGAFSYCRFLTDVYFPKSITEIGPQAFQQCDSLETIHLPDAEGKNMILSIGAEAFYDCKAFKTFSPIPQIKKIGDRCFYNNHSIDFQPWLDERNTGLEIGISAFGSCDFMEIKLIPGILKDVNTGAFADCTSLRRIDCSAFKSTSSIPQWHGEDIFESTVRPGLIIIDPSIQDTSIAEKVWPTDDWLEFFQQFKFNLEDSGWSFALPE